MIPSNSKQLPKPTKNRYLVPNPHGNWDTESTPYRDDEDAKRTMEVHIFMTLGPRQHAGGNPPRTLELVLEDLTWSGLDMDVNDLPPVPPPPKGERLLFQDEYPTDCCQMCGTGPLAPTTCPYNLVICAMCK